MGIAAESNSFPTTFFCKQGFVSDKLKFLFWNEMIYPTQNFPIVIMGLVKWTALKLDSETASGTLC